MRLKITVIIILSIIALINGQETSSSVEYANQKQQQSTNRAQRPLIELQNIDQISKNLIEPTKVIKGSSSSSASSSIENGQSKSESESSLNNHIEPIELKISTNSNDEILSTNAPQKSQFNANDKTISELKQDLISLEPILKRLESIRSKLAFLINLQTVDKSNSNSNSNVLIPNESKLDSIQVPANINTKINLKSPKIQISDPKIETSNGYVAKNVEPEIIISNPNINLNAKVEPEQFSQSSKIIPESKGINASAYVKLEPEIAVSSNNTKSEIEPKISLDPKLDTKSYSKVEPEFHESAKIILDPKIDDNVKSVIEPKHPSLEPEINTKARANVKIEPKVILEPKIDTKSQSHFKHKNGTKITVSDPKIDIKANSKIEPEVLVSSKVNLEPNIDAKANSKIEPEVLVSSKVNLDPKTDTNINSNTKSDIQSEISNLDRKIDIKQQVSDPSYKIDGKIYEPQFTAHKLLDPKIDAKVEPKVLELSKMNLDPKVDMKINSRDIPKSDIDIKPQTLQSSKIILDPSSFRIDAKVDGQEQIVADNDKINAKAYANIKPVEIEQKTIGISPNQNTNDINANTNLNLFPKIANKNINDNLKAAESIDTPSTMNINPKIHNINNSENLNDILVKSINNNNSNDIIKVVNDQNDLLSKTFEHEQHEKDENVMRNSKKVNSMSVALIDPIISSASETINNNNNNKKIVDNLAQFSPFASASVQVPISVLPTSPIHDYTTTQSPKHESATINYVNSLADQKANVESSSSSLSPIKATIKLKQLNGDNDNDNDDPNPNPDPDPDLSVHIKNLTKLMKKFLDTLKDNPQGTLSSMVNGEMLQTIQQQLQQLANSANSSNSANKKVKHSKNNKKSINDAGNFFEGLQNMLNNIVQLQQPIKLTTTPSPLPLYMNKRESGSGGELNELIKNKNNNSDDSSLTSESRSYGMPKFTQLTESSQQLAKVSNNNSNKQTVEITNKIESKKLPDKFANRSPACRESLEKLGHALNEWDHIINNLSESADLDKRNNSKNLFGNNLTTYTIINGRLNNVRSAFARAKLAYNQGNLEEVSIKLRLAGTEMSRLALNPNIMRLMPDLSTKARNARNIFMDFRRNCNV